MKTAQRWWDTYRKINFEIMKWTYDYESGYIWNYYIYLKSNILTEESFDKIWLPAIPYKTFKTSPINYRYEYDKSILNHGDFYGGITFYEKSILSDYDIKLVKVGCDYNHLWDIGFSYSENYLMADAKKTIDKLLEVLELKLENC